MPNEVTFNYTDEDGESRRGSFLVPSATVDPADLDALEAAINVVSNAGLDKTYIGVELNNGSFAPAAGAYDVADKCVLEYLTSLGEVIEVTFPSPSESIFIDSDNVDLTETVPGTYDNAAVEALHEAILVGILSPAGGVPTTLLRGYRTRSSRRL